MSFKSASNPVIHHSCPCPPCRGEMSVICEDVSLLKRVVDERLSFSKLQRSTMSSLSSSLHYSLHKSWSSSDRTTEAITSLDKHIIAEAAIAVANKDLDDNVSTVEVSKIWMTMWALWKSQMEMKLPIKAVASQWISTRTAMAARFAEDAQEVAGLPESVEG